MDVSGCRGDSATQGDKEQPLILEGRPGSAGTACTSHSASISGPAGHVPAGQPSLPRAIHQLPAPTPTPRGHRGWTGRAQALARWPI